MLSCTRTNSKHPHIHSHTSARTQTHTHTHTHSFHTHTQTHTHTHTHSLTYAHSPGGAAPEVRVQDRLKSERKTSVASTRQIKHVKPKWRRCVKSNTPKGSGVVVSSSGPSCESGVGLVRGRGRGWGLGFQKVRLTWPSGPRGLSLLGRDGVEKWGGGGARADRNRDRGVCVCVCVGGGVVCPAHHASSLLG